MFRSDPNEKNIQKMPRRLPALLALGLLPGLLTACAGGAVNLSWAGIAAAGDRIYVAHNSSITAVNLGSGQQAWKYPEKADAKQNFYCDPMIDSKGALVAGAYNGAVVKLDAVSGALKWKLEGDGEKIIAPIAEGPDGAYYVSSESGDLLVIDPDSGTIRKRIPLGKQTSWGPMAVNGERIYIATIEHKVLAVNFGSGAIEWTVDLGAAIAGGVNLVDGKLVVGTFTDKIIALDPKDGAKIWEIAADGFVWTAPIISDGTIFATDLGGVLRAVKLEDGAAVWRADLTETIQAGPAGDGSNIYVGTTKGKVRAYSIASGAQVWEQSVSKGGIYGRVRVEGGKVLVVVNGGDYVLAALSPENGSILWTYKVS
jgi:outer membrane protein assembly factor BamB